MMQLIPLDCVLNVFLSLCFNIRYSFTRHKVHWLDGLLFVVAWLIIFQVMLNFEFFFFNLKTYLESSVSSSYFCG